MENKIIRLEHSDIFPFQYEADKPTIHKIGGRYFEVTVNFDQFGIKKMFASFAKLRKL